LGVAVSCCGFALGQIPSTNKVFENNKDYNGERTHMGYWWVTYGERAVKFEALLEANQRKHKNKREIHDRPKEA
jgi:hypothetical protein